ncbi:MAG TPA: VCBS repeat-containing protein, partial [Blastocatellia bacterium]|nr:VCBS repeat-containing protein [Blastocatellia bacterium]
MSAKTSGIAWVHDNGRSPERHLPETCGGGGLFFDFDNDGWLDVYLVNSGPSDFYKPAKPLKNALYRNNHDGTFTDIAEKAGVACGQEGDFGMGAAAADFNGDGWQDLY